MSPSEPTRPIADQIRAALEAHAPDTLAPLLADNARWGSCVGGGQVVDWMRGAAADGMTAEVSAVVPYADRVVLELDLSRRSPDGLTTDAETIYQVAFVRDGKITEIADAGSHDDALATSPSPPPMRPSGPPTGIDRMAAVLPVRDLEAALEHYRRLGFDARPYEGGGYGYADRQGAQLHLTVVDDLDPRTTTSAVYLYVDDADALHAEWVASGTTGQFFGPEDTPYGLREGAHIDRDGNLIRFGSRLSRLDPTDRTGPQTIG